MQMREAIVFKDYDRIVDDLMYFGSGVQLKFNVSLARKGSDGRRHHFHNIYRYDSKYDDYGKVLTIRRHFDYYISIDVKDNFGSSIMITAKDILNVRMRLNQVYKWFTTGQVFKIDKKKKLHVVGAPGVVKIMCTGEKYIMFEPTVITYDNNQQREGVRMYINSESLYVDYNVDTLMEFIYLIGSINMYECANIMVGYIRPEIDELDIRDIDNSGPKDVVDTDSGDANIRRNHIVKDETRNGSFFDKMDGLGGE